MHKSNQVSMSNVELNKIKKKHSRSASHKICIYAHAEKGKHTHTHTMIGLFKLIFFSGFISLLHCVC